MSGLVDDVMDIARARLNGGMQLERTEVDMDLLVRRVIASPAMVAAQRAREVSIDVTSDGNLRACVDVRRTEQLVASIISKVIEQSAPGTQITVTLVGRDIELTMRVHHRGMRAPQPVSASLRPRLLRPFVRTRSGSGVSSGATRAIANANANAHARAATNANANANANANTMMNANATMNANASVIATANANAVVNAIVNGAAAPTRSGVASLIPTSRRRIELYLAAKIAEAHRGRIDITSDEDGSTFTLTLPRML